MKFRTAAAALLAAIAIAVPVITSGPVSAAVSQPAVVPELPTLLIPGLTNWLHDKAYFILPVSSVRMNCHWNQYIIYFNPGKRVRIGRLVCNPTGVVNYAWQH
jgi:hypothetical protein